MQASSTNGVRYSQVLVHRKACCDYVLYAPWNDVTHAHFVSKVHLYMYKVYMHHSEGKHHNVAADIAPWSSDWCGD